jgi:hypothetical protein
LVNNDIKEISVDNNVIDNNIDSISNVMYNCKLQVQGGDVTPLQGQAARDSGSAATSYTANHKQESAAAGFVSGCAQNINTENDNTENDEISVLTDTEAGDLRNNNILIENRGLSIHNETQWLPHIGITDLGNLDHMSSGVSKDKIIYDHDRLVFRGYNNLQVDNSKNYTPVNEEASFLENN